MCSLLNTLGSETYRSKVSDIFPLCLAPAATRSKQGQGSAEDLHTRPTGSQLAQVSGPVLTTLCSRQLDEALTRLALLLSACCPCAQTGRQRADWSQAVPLARRWSPAIVSMLWSSGKMRGHKEDMHM